MSPTICQLSEHTFKKRKIKMQTFKVIKKKKTLQTKQVVSDQI